MALHDNLSALWRLDRSLVDWSGNANSLTASGSPNYTTGKIGFALRSPTSSDGAQRSGLIIPSGSFSMGGWFFLTANFLVAPLFQQGDGGSASQHLRATTAGASGAISFEVAGFGGGGASADIFSLPAWFHLVGTYDSSTNACVLYINGASAGTGTAAASFASSGQITSVGFVGNNRLADLPFFYSRVITPTEVAQLYNSGLGRDPTCDRLCEVADIATAAIGVTWAPTGNDDVIRAFAIEQARESMAGRKVYVFPLGDREVERLDRATVVREYDLAVITVEKYTDPGLPTTAWMDTRMRFTRELVYDVLNVDRESEYLATTLYAQRIDRDIAYDFDAFLQSIFWCEVNVTLREKVAG